MVLSNLIRKNGHVGLRQSETRLQMQVFGSSNGHGSFDDEKTASSSESDNKLVIDV